MSTASFIPLDIDGSRMAKLVRSLLCLHKKVGAKPFSARALAQFVIDDPDTVETHDATVAAEFLVWLWFQGLTEARLVDRFEHVREMHVAGNFALDTVAFYGSPETRAAVAKWLADPWLPWFPTPAVSVAA